MELVTHVLSGIVVSRAFLAPFIPGPVVAALTVATIIPDIESVTLGIGMDAYLRYHRGLSHSFLFAPIISLAVAACFKVFSKEAKFFPLLVACFFGVVLHLLLDWVNSYGTQLLYPLSRRFFALDLDIILDLWVLIPLAIGASFQTFFPARSSFIGLLSVLICLSALGCRAVLRAKAIEKVKGNIVAAFPGKGTIFGASNWRVIEKLDTGLIVNDVNVISGEIRKKMLPCLPWETLPSVVASSGIGEAFVYWSRCPCLQEKKTSQGREITGSDLRFDNNLDGQGGFLHIEFDSFGKVIHEEYSFRKPFYRVRHF